MSRFVLDNTIAMAWCFSDETTSYTDYFLNRLSNLVDVAVVPALWVYEVSNVTSLAVRNGRITNADAAQFLTSLNDLPIELEPLRHRREVLSALAAVSKRYSLTAYDAAYLEIALRRNLPVATLDRRLIEACRQASVTVL